MEVTIGGRSLSSVVGLLVGASVSTAVGLSVGGSVSAVQLHHRMQVWRMIALRANTSIQPMTSPSTIGSASQVARS